MSHVTVIGPAIAYDFSGNAPSTQTIVNPGAGQSLADIAAELHVDADALAKANPQIKDPKQTLSPFQEIRVPNDLKPQLPVPYDSSATSAPRQTSSAPNAGEVEAKSMAEAKMRQATINGLTQKASSIGLGPGDVALIASLGTRFLTAKDFNAATAAVQQALSSANPPAAMAQLGPRIVQGSADPVVAESTTAMAARTGHVATTLGPDVLKGVEEVTVVAHGDEVAVQIEGKLYSPKQLAEALRASGWEGGTLRLAACKTGSTNATFAKNLASELNKLGMDSAVIAPKDSAFVTGGEEGLPQVKDAAETAKRLVANQIKPEQVVVQKPGKGWEIFTDDAPEVAAQGAKGTGEAAVRTVEKEVGEAVAEGVAAAGETGGAVAGARVAAGEALGFVGFMLEPLQMMASYFGTFEEIKNAVKSRGYTDGFTEGIAAAMKGVPRDEVREKFGREVANDSIGTRVGGAEGVEDRYHNKGLVDGYKYFQSLSPEKQQKLRDAAKANGWDLEKDRVTELERGVRPMVEDMFKRMEEEREKAAQKKAMKLMGWEE